MAKVTNTGDQVLYIAQTQIPPHSTVDVKDEDLAEAKTAKMVEGWFANGSLKIGDEAAKDEADKQQKLHESGTASVSGTGIHPNVDPKAGVVHSSSEPDVEKKP